MYIIVVYVYILHVLMYVFEFLLHTFRLTQIRTKYVMNMSNTLIRTSSAFSDGIPLLENMCVCVCTRTVYFVARMCYTQSFYVRACAYKAY